MSAFAYLQMWQWSPYDAGATDAGIEYLRDNEPHASQTWAEFLAAGPPADIAMPASIADEIRAFKAARLRVWEWDVEAPFHPHYDATASPDGLAYGCEIKGPFCGYDAQGTQTWAEFLASGPPAKIEMPAAIAAEIRSFGLARKH